MSRFLEVFNASLEYFGIPSRNYSHSVPVITYDDREPLAYYFDTRPRVAYGGPFDAHGIPLYVKRGCINYLPVLIAAFGLGHFEMFRRQLTEENRLRFLDTCRWLISHQNENGAWISHIPMEKYGLHKPFPSAMAQGLAISCLTRAAAITGEVSFLDRARRALAPFHVDIAHGGVVSREEGRVFYEEYPAVPYRHVLNGFIFSLWGLLDLIRMDDNQEASRLYCEGLATLIDWLPRFDLGYWSLYHIGAGPPNPATVSYHRLHVRQMQAMYLITGHNIFRTYGLWWEKCLGKRLNAFRTLPAKIRWFLGKPPRCL